MKKIMLILMNLIIATIIGGTIGVQFDLSTLATSGVITGIAGLMSTVSLPVGSLAVGCGAVYESIVATCLDTNSTGAKDKLYFIPIEYIDKTATDFNATNDLIIEGLTLIVESPVLTGFTIEGKNLGVDGDCSPVAVGNGYGWLHNLKFMIQDNSPELKKNIEEMLRGRFLVIRENNFVNANATTNPGASAFEILGYDLGIEFKEPKNTLLDVKLGNGWSFTMGTVEGNPEPRIVRNFYKTDYATTKALIEALVA